MLQRAAVLAVLVGLSACGKTTAKPDAGVDAGPTHDAGTPASPVVTAVQPSTGPTDGGTTVTITGSGFVAGAHVRFGGAAAPTATVGSATSITAVTPPGAAGAVSVVVVNPDTRLGTLSNGFTYQETAASTVSWCKLQFPAATTGAPGAPLTLFARVYAAGVTDAVGAGAGIHVQGAVGTVAAGFTWADAVFNTDADSNANDEYKLVTTYPGTLGSYASVLRAQLNNGAWTYCEVDGPHAAVDEANLGSVTVAPPPPDAVDWCNLQFPLSATLHPSDPFTLFGQVFKAGVTEAAGAGPGIRMQAGLGDGDGGWAWEEASFNQDVANNDEYQWLTSTPAVGSYATAYRASFDGGVWTYCEVDGPHADLDPTQLGSLTVTPAPTQIDWCRLQFPADATGAPGAPLTLYARVYTAGVTDAVGAGPGVHVQGAVGDPDAGLAWADAVFNADTDNLANDEFVLATAFPSALGSYASAFRAQLNGGAWSYCEVDGPHVALDDTQLGAVTVSPPPPDAVDWCNLQFPQATTLHPGDAFGLYGQVFKGGLTEAVGAGAGVAMEAGLSLSDGGWTWTAAGFNQDVGNNDEYLWSSTAPDLGHYFTAYRASLDGGAWTYCETDGPHPALSLQQAGTLDVVPVPAAVVSWCNLQFPTAAQGAPLARFTLYGQVFQPGLTDGVGQGPGIAVEAGISLPDAGWSWTAAAYDADRGNNDEYQWLTNDPSTPGTYLTAFRAALDGGPWSYCEVDGLHATLDPSQAGSLTVVQSAPPKVNWCNLQFPTAATGAPGAALTLYGQVFEAGVTEAAGEGAGIHVQGGVSLEDGGFGWQDALYSADRGNNDEYRLDTTDPVTPGSYQTAFRAQLDGGPWVYCEPGGPSDALGLSVAGTLTVQSTGVGAVSWCNLQFPTQASAHPGDALTFYGRVYQAGVTDQVGQGAGVYLEAGLSQADGGFGWSAASFNVDADGQIAGDHANDEYQWAGSAPAAGNYGSAFRAALDGGPWTYCEVDGPHADLDPSHTGTLSVTDPAPPLVTWCNLQFPTQASGHPGDAISFYGQVFQPGATDQPGAAASVLMQAGLSQDDGGWSWSATTYNVDVGSNDEYRWDTTNPAAGSYLTAFRASLDGGPWTYCEPDGPHPSLDPSRAGTLVVQ